MQKQISETFLGIQTSWIEFSSAQYLDSDETSLEKQKSYLTHQISLIADESVKKRIYEEFFEYGPLNLLISDESITEILVNSSRSIWFEKFGKLQKHDDIFFSEISFNNVIERICQKADGHLSLNHPYLESRFLDFRVSLIDRSITQNSALISLRRHPVDSWNIEKLMANNWCTQGQGLLIKNLISKKRNFLIVGETGSGKTSVANACLHLTQPVERSILIEDCSELVLPNDCSIKLLTRNDPYSQLIPVTQQDLIRRSLRLRPDRLIMGEIRSHEAKDFLMMLSTGHAGSFATLHAKDPQEALIRLEMLVQLGAPQWKLAAIRRLIFLSLHYILITERTSTGLRKLKNIYKLISLEESGFTLEPAEDWALAASSSD